MAWVRVMVGPGGPRAEAFGLCHRLPARRPITLRAAAALGAVGTPVVVVRTPGGQA